MAYNFYLLNGKRGKGTALNVLSGDVIRRDFPDISTLDLVTMEIKEKDAKDYFEDLNKGVDLTGMFYDASYPHKENETKTYPTIFNFDSDKSKYYMDKLRYFAEQRNYKKENGLNLKLDENRTFEDYIRTILYNILSNYDSKIVDYESLLAAALKEMIKERFNDYKYKGTNNYINSRIYKLRSILSGYTQLRNLTLQYLLSINGQNTKLRSDINRVSIWDNTGMEKKTPTNVKGEIVEPFHQMTLDDYIDIKTGMVLKNKRQ